MKNIIFDEKFSVNQPFAAKYFQAAINNSSQKLSHAYMLTGSDLISQYYAAIQIAKALNCKNQDHIGCNCTSCSWINQNRHPAVITISPIDYTYNQDGADNGSSTVIKVDQVRYLRKSLAVSSQYHRIIIFTDAAEGKDYESKASSLWKGYQEILKPPANLKNEERENWIPQPVSSKILQTEAANTLLKTLEEPGSNITFFFLTKDKEDMLETIVSRCHTIPILNRNIAKADLTVLKDLIDILPPKSYGESLLLTEKLTEISNNESLNLVELLDIMQEYFRQLVKNNQNSNIEIKLFKYIENIEKAKLEMKSYVNPQSVLDDLFLAFI